jgi:hypothetical protein
MITVQIETEINSKTVFPPERKKSKKRRIIYVIYDDNGTKRNKPNKQQTIFPLEKETKKPANNFRRNVEQWN